MDPLALEAVLAHELAHLKRHDYFANVVQNMIEALLFFHPAAWWLSAQVRELREHCCDDIAAEIVGDPMILAEGLCALERLRQNHPSDPELALAAAKGSLMNRITRLFDTSKPQPFSFRSFQLMLIGSLALCTVALTAKQLSSTLTESTAPTAVKVAYQPPPPPYPFQARNSQTQGIVVLNLDINDKGRPGTLSVLQGPEALREEAAKYARQWRFQVAPGASRSSFRLNLIYRLDGLAQDYSADDLSQTSGPSATIEIVARALDAKTSDLPLTELSKIVIAHQPPPPAYPAEAKKHKIQSTVIVEISMDECGIPYQVEAIEGPMQLRETAETYAEAWKFEPAKQDGKAVKARFRFTMPFRAC